MRLSNIFYFVLLIAAGVAAGPATAQIDRAATCLVCSCPRTWSENFDSVVPPALPPGWLATNALGPPPLWVTSNSGVPSPPADSSPNSAFIDDPDVISDKRLDSPNLLPPEPGLRWRRLTFRHNFNFDA